MDKNLIIAILLSTLVIIIFTSPQYQKRFGKNLPPRQTVENPVQENRGTVHPQSSTAPEPEEKPLPSINATQEAAADTLPSFAQINRPEREERITIENKDISIDISSIAGALVHATMKNYDGPTSDERAQLIPEGQKWCDGRIVGEKGTVYFSELNFAVEEMTNDRVTLVADLASNRRITRTYVLDPDGYMVHTTTKLDGDWDNPELYYEWNSPLNDTEEPTRVLRIFPFSLFMRDDTMTYLKIAYLGQGDRTYIDRKGKHVEKRIYSNEGSQKVEIKSSKDRPTHDDFKGDLDWYAVRNKYFMTAAIPHNTKRWRASSDAQMVMLDDTERKWFSFTIIKSLSAGDTSLDIYTGPIAYDLLKQYNSNLTEIMELSWRFIRPLAIAFLWIVKKIRIVVPNWGLVIIVFSIFIKVILYPLSRSSIKSMQKMSKLQPQLAEIREKHKNNQQKQHLEMMDLYKREGVNPFGGCLPMLLQMPVFFALYPVVGRAFELRKALFIPHWIDDLSRPDPYYLLPIAMGISMFFQSKSTMNDPNQKAMVYVMPVMMVILFANFSAGLTLYWFMFNILTSLQQKMVKA